MRKLSIVPFFVVCASACAQTPISAADALNLAAKNRDSLLASRFALEQARAQAQAKYAVASLELSAGASSRSDIGAVDQDLALTQSFDLFGQRKADKLLGLAEIKLAQAQYAKVAGQLQTEVLTAFAVAVSAKHQSEVALQLQAVSEALLLATQRRFDEGKIAELQVTRAFIEYERSKQATLLRQSDSQASLIRLGSLIGVAPDSLHIQPDAEIAELIEPQLQNRPDILALQAELDLTQAESAVLSASSRPKFSVQVLRSPWSNEPGHFAGRAQFTWNLYDYGKLKKEKEAVKLKERASLLAIEDSLALANADLEAVQIELETCKKRIASYESILLSAKELVQKSQKGFSEGFGTQVDVLEATRSLREVEHELVEAKQQLSLAVIRQYEVSGFLVEVLK